MSNQSNEVLKEAIERIERLERDKAQVTDDIAAVYTELKSRGFNTKITKKLIAKRARDKAQLSEEDSLLETYEAAVAVS